MDCGHFQRDECHSCLLLPLRYAEQVEGKEAAVRAELAAVLGRRAGEIEWLPPFRSAEAGFRNKAKLAVTGTAAEPILGLAHPPLGRGVDLADCPLYPAELQAAFAPLREFIALADLTPYDVTASPGRTSVRAAAARGELKRVIVPVSPASDLLVRLVLRPREPIDRIRKHLPWLQEALPRLAVCSVNLQPEHKAVLEGPEEILLTERAMLPMPLPSLGSAGLTLYLRPQGFFQTNTAVATELYRQAAAWAEASGATSCWDLYCGVGGFALACAGGGRRVVGAEVSPEAVAAARQAAAEAGVTEATFVAEDATEFALRSAPAERPDLLVVNPPRRGLGADLAAWIEASAIPTVIYSSCQAATLAKDLAVMGSYRVRQARLLDMFAHTAHYEVIVLLERA
ncbi:MAG: methyltransferase domain-containing protein [Promicromonosporaceae bacterium]|nr:methyltransferase domain-containing protein [Promicromonosporaceae bacterium]